MASYQKMFGFSHAEFLQRGFQDKCLPACGVEYVEEDLGPVLLVCVDEHTPQEVEEAWPEFQKGMRKGALVQFRVECPTCRGESYDPGDNCPTCGSDQVCSLCEGYGTTVVLKTAGQEGSQVTETTRVSRWRHALVNNPKVSTVEVWERWPDLEWRWHISHSVPREPNHELQKIVERRSPQEEHWTWSVAFQGGDFEKWHGADQWMIGGVCFSEKEAKDTCERLGPKLYEMWVLTMPRKH